MSRQQSAASTLEEIVEYHISDTKHLYGEKTNELEVRFGTKGARITKIQFENVIRMLKSHQFSSYAENGTDSLKIQNEFIDIKSGRTKLSNVRFVIRGTSAIQRYCKSNSLDDLNYDMSYESKSYAKNGDKVFYPIDNENFNFRISYQTETKMTDKSPVIKEMTRKWDESQKMFRFLNRITYIHNTSPVKVDMSITKMPPRRGRSTVLSYKVEDSGVFQGQENYEIEIELDSTKIGEYSQYKTHESITKEIKRVIKLILSGLQNTNYPIPLDKQNSVLNNYAALLGIPDKKRYLPKDFCGPASYTLELKNIQPMKEEDGGRSPNIRNNYTVTDKADGSRKLLFVDNDGKMYFITTTMDVEFTGFITTDEKLHKSLLDGEHVLHNKTGGYMNLYAAFDAYYIAGKSIREKAFVPLEADAVRSNYRLALLNNYMTAVNKSLRCVTQKEGDDAMNTRIVLSVKNFYTGNVFESCRKILEKENDGLFDYETDGLIFTPTDFGVGGNKEGEASKPMKVTWEHSFKWKPPEFNTVDFLVTLKKDKTGKVMVGNTFSEGTNMAQTDDLQQFKTLILRCGYDERKHGMLDPCNDVYQDNIREKDYDNEDAYKPVPFHPTSPFDNEAHLCEIIMKRDKNYTLGMFCENDDVIEDNMIVEFRYDMTKDAKRRWIPLRARYDKTQEFRAGQKNYGNAYHVANSNWHSIHHPVTAEMLSTGANIPEDVTDITDMYYNRKSGEKHTAAMRDFHNLMVKRRLILDVAKRGDTLMDFTVGKGGDIAKWTAARLSFVFGADIAQDNLENKIDGACARYINYRREHRYVPGAIFVNADSSKNIRDGTAIGSEKQRGIMHQVFGAKAKTDKYGRGVEKAYGRGKDGFDITTAMFSLHYFFKNTQTLEGFVKNVSECTKTGGYFVGCCFDGKKIFNELKGVEKGGNRTLIKNGTEDTKIWEVIKNYEMEDFEDDESSLGYSISVYQDSINNYFDEYLVNFDYFERVMENQGFKALTKEEAGEMGFTSSVGDFKSLFEQTRVKADQDTYYRKKIGKTLQMDEQEKYISYLNKYFIFKKVLNVPLKDVQLGEPDEATITERVAPKSKKDQGKKERKTKKSKKKLVLDD